MNRSIIRSLAPAFAGAFLFATASAEAQVVTTGIVLGVDPAKGIVSVRSDQSRKVVNFINMNKAPISRASGKKAALEDVWTDMRVTISYRKYANRWYVGHLYIPDLPKNPPAQTDIWLLTPGQRNAIYSKAARDNDITTQPGSRAYMDNDITTKPPRRALFENDITLRNDNR